MNQHAVCDFFNKTSDLLQFAGNSGDTNMLEADYFDDEITLTLNQASDRPSRPAYRLVITHHSGARAVFAAPANRKGSILLRKIIFHHIGTRPFSIIQHARGLYRLLDPNGFEYIGEYVTLKDAKHTCRNNFIKW